MLRVFQFIVGILLTFLPTLGLAGLFCQTHIINTTPRDVSFYFKKVDLDHYLGRNIGRAGFRDLINNRLCMSKRHVIAVIHNHVGTPIEYESKYKYTNLTYVNGTVANLVFPRDFKNVVLSPRPPLCITKIENSSARYVSFYVKDAEANNLLGTNAGKPVYRMVDVQHRCYIQQQIMAVVRGEKKNIPYITRHKFTSLTYVTGQATVIKYPKDFVRYVAPLPIPIKLIVLAKYLI